MMNFSLLNAASSFISQASSDASAAEGAFGLFAFGCLCCIMIFAIVPYTIGLYKIFEKAGQPGWQAIVPYLNSAVTAHIVGREWWWGLIPGLNLVVLFDLAKAFGKSDGYGIGLLLLGPVFIPMLGFSDAQLVVERKPPLF